MKITVERDNRIYKHDEPEVETIMIDRPVCGLEDLLLLYTDLARALGYHIDGTLMDEVDEEPIADCDTKEGKDGE